MATSLLRGVRSIRRNSAGMVLGFVVSVLTVWIYLLLVMVVHFWRGLLPRNGSSAMCCSLTLRQHPALVAALGFCVGYPQPPAETTVYPTLAPGLRQRFPREMVVNVGG